MVYYLKYRPKKVEDLDLVNVRDRLSSILGSKSIPHAFLFSGPRGLGKTSSARILAREVHGGELDPDVFEQIAQGSHPDVIEIDAASNRGVDEMRELRERVKYAPMSLPKKVYIIDEVHMLTREAFNALLKTLEEPPEHVIFVLATTEPWKLPETVISRTFHVQFEQPSISEIVASLERIVKGEGLKIEKGVLEEIAKLADGAFRDGAKILEELAISAGGNKISAKILESTYKISTVGAKIDVLFESLDVRDRKKGVDVIEEIFATGADMGFVTEKILERLHGMLVAGEGNFSAGEIERLVDLFTRAFQQIKISPVPQLPLQMVVVEWEMEEIQNSKLKIKNDSLKVKAKGMDDSGSVGPARGFPLSTPVTQATGDLPSVRSSARPASADTARVSGRLSTPISRRSQAKAFPSTSVTHKNKNTNLLKNLISEIDKENRMLAGLLRSVSLEEKKNEIVIVCMAKFHKERIEEGKNLSFIKKKIKEISGKDSVVTVTIDEDS